MMDIGWLAPNGDWYPCESDDSNFGRIMHHQLAADIIEKLYPNGVPVPDDYDSDTSDENIKLVRVGWLRVDIEECMWVDDLNDAQIKRLQWLMVQHYTTTEMRRMIAILLQYSNRDEYSKYMRALYQPRHQLSK